VASLIGRELQPPDLLPTFVGAGLLLVEAVGDMLVQVGVKIHFLSAILLATDDCDLIDGLLGDPIELLETSTASAARAHADGPVWLAEAAEVLVACSASAGSGQQVFASEAEDV